MKTESGMMIPHTGNCILQEHVLQSSMDFKIHKKDTLLRPVVSSRGPVMYGVAKELGRISKPLDGQSTHNLHNSQEFKEHVKNINPNIGEWITSYDVTAIFTSVPVGPSIQIIKNRLGQDTQIQHRIVIFVQHILQLLEFCPQNTYFLFHGWYYEQMEGAVKGFPVSPIVANIHMEECENKSIRTAENPPRLWTRYVNGTFLIQDREHNDKFLQHINSIDKAIQFTVKDIKAQGTKPFLDTIIISTTGGTLSTRVYRKPTHILQLDSPLHIAEKYIESLVHSHTGPKQFVQLQNF